MLRAPALRSCARRMGCLAALLLCTARAEAVFVQGIDVYNGDGAVNWTSVKNAGVDFAFVKATEGIDFLDARFHTNMNGAEAAGVLVGPYHFCRLDSYATNPLDPVNEANDFLEAILPHYRTGRHLPPVADVERFPPFGTTAEARAFTSNWVQLFSDTIYNALGVRPIIYQSLSKANTYYTPAVASTHELWLAWWRGTGTTQPPQPSDTPLWGEWLFWQWTDSWTVPGISGNVDGDVFDGTMDELEDLLLGNDGSIPGDFNRDDSVDAADYIIWRKTLGQTVPIYSGADGNGNSHIDAGDLTVWKTNIGSTAGAGSGNSTSGISSFRAAIPEPPTLSMLLPALVATLGRRFCTRR